jgi:hypothetical protein
VSPLASALFPRIVTVFADAGHESCTLVETIELLAVNAEEDADVISAEDSAEEGIKFVGKERVGHREDADDQSIA